MGNPGVSQLLSERTLQQKASSSLTEHLSFCGKQPGRRWRRFTHSRAPMSRSSPYRRLALTAALVAGVEGMGLALFDDVESFHGAAEGANRNSDEFEALDFSVRIDCV